MIKISIINGSTVLLGGFGLPIFCCCCVGAPQIIVFSNDKSIHLFWNQSSVIRAYLPDQNDVHQHPDTVNINDN